MIKEQLDEILEKHKKWLNDEPDGERADLYEADLREADLQGADLYEANLWRADLQGADLRGVNLREADLQGADLRGANLRRTDLQGADLYEANLREADLRGADLQGADLRRADLWGADLYGADLRGADLREAGLRRADLREADLQAAALQGADLQGADLQGADLRGADLWGADNIPDYICPICCPEKGSFTGFKQAYWNNMPVIVELEISTEAKRSSATNRKCRCNKAKVLSITGLQGIAEFQKAHSRYDNDFIYEVGKTVIVDDYDDNRWNECSTGIHFFITRDEAVRY